MNFLKDIYKFGNIYYSKVLKSNPFLCLSKKVICVSISSSFLNLDFLNSPCDHDIKHRLCSLCLILFLLCCLLILQISDTGICQWKNMFISLNRLGDMIFYFIYFKKLFLYYMVYVPNRLKFFSWITICFCLSNYDIMESYDKSKDDKICC